MAISKEKTLEVLYDHYKDSFSYVSKYLQQRERIFVVVLVIVFLQFLQISFAEQYLEAFNAFVEQRFDLAFVFSQSVLNNLLWFLLLSTSLRYFQVNILINRQYDYIHELEEKLSKIADTEGFIQREGYGYLKDYPLFLDWVHMLYTWIFPLLLILVSVTKIASEVVLTKQFSWSLLVSIIFFLIIIITSILYLVHIHKKHGEESSDENI
jgi:hypothetical protein